MDWGLRLVFVFFNILFTYTQGGVSQNGSGLPLEGATTVAQTTVLGGKYTKIPNERWMTSFSLITSADLVY